MIQAVKSVVAIPVRDEEERIGACLRALAGQRGARLDAVVLLLNNCTDATASAVERARPALGARLVVRSCELPSALACAGIARAMAMEHAAELAGEAGVLLTTDADGRAAPDWLAANLHAFRAGADAVAGRAVIDPEEALRIPSALHEADARECAYGNALDEIASLLDPDPADPWPRHTEESGASLAVRTAVWRQVGGVPRVRLGEDRAFAAALRRHDARLRHEPGAWVTVSGRIEGRAEGGMADTIRRRLSAQDAFLDDRLEPALDASRRARLRRAARRVHAARAANFTAVPLADLLGLGVEQLSLLLRHPHFGAAWAAIEAAAPSLRWRRVAVTRLPREMAAAMTVLAQLHDDAGVKPIPDQADIAAPAPL